MEENNKKIFFLNHGLQDAFLRMDALRVFYQDSIERIQCRRIHIENKYKYALMLSEKFDELFNSDEPLSETDFNESLKDISVSDNHNLSEYVSVHIKAADEENSIRIRYELKGEKEFSKYYDPRKAQHEQRKCLMNEQILITSVLSNSITIFENYLSGLYRFVIMSNPKKYFGGRSIEFADLISDGLQKTITSITEKEIEDKIYDSLATIDLIAKKEKLPIEKYKSWMMEFKEIYFRRNIYIHNNGEANEKYLNNVDEIYRKNTYMGEQLICDELYINRLFDVVSIIIISLYFEVINTLSNNKSAFSWLGNQAFELLCNENYQVSGHIYSLLSKTESLNFHDKLTYRINYINSEKQLGHKETVVKELLGLDVSATTVDFKIAKLCLEDKNDMVYKLLKETYPSSYDAEEIREWPIFIGFRETDFYDRFAKEHADDFNLHIYAEEEKS